MSSCPSAKPSIAMPSTETPAIATMLVGTPTLGCTPQSTTRKMKMKTFVPEPTSEETNPPIRPAMQSPQKTRTFHTGTRSAPRPCYRSEIRVT